MPSISAIGNGSAARRGGSQRVQGRRPPSTAIGRAPSSSGLRQNQAVGGVVVHDQDRQPSQPRDGPARRGASASCGLDAQLTVNRKVLPMPGSLSTQIRPPISSTSLAEIVRPSPVPPNRRVVEPSACSNGWKIVSSFSAGMPIPVSATAKWRTTPSTAGVLERNGDDDFAPLGELDRVADQVDQDLAQPAGVADQGVGHVGGDPAGQLQALGVRPQGQGLQGLVQRVAQAKRASGRG